jgi:ureidoacrylate peracid hydrolase
MHSCEIPDWAVERIAGFRAERRMTKAIDPRRTAHVVVDMQNGFLEPGAPVEVPAAREIVPAINRITAALRPAGATVAFLRFKTDPAASGDWSVFYGAMFGARHREAMAKAFAPGAHHFALWDELDRAPDDWVVDKTRYSAFVPGTCDLYERLTAAGIDTLIITGTLSNCCCESTARDAMQRNFRVIFISDGNATLTDAEHRATLANMAVLFADVMPAEEAVALLASTSETKVA